MKVFKLPKPYQDGGKCQLNTGGVCLQSPADGRQCRQIHASETEANDISALRLSSSRSSAGF